MDRLFVDTSAWYAFINKAERDHHRIRDLLHNFSGRLITSNFVFDETITFCLYRLGHRAALTVGETLQKAPEIDLVRITPDDERRAWELFGQRTDKTYSYTDCTSFVIMRRLGLSIAASLDADFEREGFILVPDR